MIGNVEQLQLLRTLYSIIIIIIILFFLNYYYCYYYYAALNTPCIGHKDNESQAHD